MSKISKRRSSEALVMRGYLQLAFVVWDETGVRAGLLAEYGDYSVRLVEILSAPGGEMPYLRLELHAKSDPTPIESCTCGDLEETVRAAERLMGKAQRLQDEARTGSDKTAPDSAD